jgi:hypothetical protein
MGTNSVPRGGAEPNGIQAALTTALFTSPVHPCKRVMTLRAATVTVNFAISRLLMIFLSLVETAVTLPASAAG